VTSAPERIETSRLILRKPLRMDAAAIFNNYAADPDVTRYLAFRTHRSVEDTNQFLEFSDAEWSRRGVGPYLIELRSEPGVIGSTGLDYTSDSDAVTGYLFAKSTWGRGYATEALHAIVDLANALGIRRVTAGCHPAHIPSQIVLLKCGFVLEPDLKPHVFPNLGSSGAVPTLIFVNLIEQRA
jgi:RimJ/RimL family protein N-acetyltransferase